MCFSFWLWQKSLTQLNRNLSLEFWYSFSWCIYRQENQDLAVYLNWDIGILARLTCREIKKEHKAMLLLVLSHGKTYRPQTL